MRRWTWSNRHADRHVRSPPGGDVEHADEEREDQQRGAEISLHDEDAERGDHGQEDRGEVPRFREFDSAEPTS
jgi:hypothetical protein